MPFMYRNISRIRRFASGNGLPYAVCRFSTRSGLYAQKVASHNSKCPWEIKCIEVPDFSYSGNSDHISQVAHHLRQTGILKASLGFPDPDSAYLRDLVFNLHQYHDHNPPVSHNAYQGQFWDVRPTSSDFQAKTHQARSETMNEFPWHTDCSYEVHPPRYFALHVLQHDRYGGGTLSVMNVNGLTRHLSPTTVASLSCPEYLIKVPPEFIKEPGQESILGCVLTADQNTGDISIRFRRDIMSALTPRASRALEELDQLFRSESIQESLSLRLSPDDLPKDSVILVDNRRWLHARSCIRDPERHLRRVRWDAAPF